VGKGIAVSDTGAIAANAPSIAALDALRAARTFEDRKRGMLDALAYAVNMGVTTSADMGAFVIPGLPDIQDSFTFNTLASAEPFHMYDVFLTLHRDGKMSGRLRIFFLSMDTQPEHSAAGGTAAQQFSGHGRRHASRLGHRRIPHPIAALRTGGAAAQLHRRAATDRQAGMASSAT
jgi:hypothetical protein